MTEMELKDFNKAICSAGVTTEEAKTAIAAASLALFADTDIQMEISCIRSNPSLLPVTKWRLIRKLKKEIEQRGNQRLRADKGL